MKTSYNNFFIVSSWFYNQEKNHRWRSRVIQWLVSMKQISGQNALLLRSHFLSYFQSLSMQSLSLQWHSLPLPTWSPYNFIWSDSGIVCVYKIFHICVQSFIHSPYNNLQFQECLFYDWIIQIRFHTNSTYHLVFLILFCLFFIPKHKAKQNPKNPHK